MTVTIHPEPCRRRCWGRHWHGPQAQQPVLCGDTIVRSDGQFDRIALCELCRSLGDQLAGLGGEWCGTDIGDQWERCLVWNLALAALLCSALEVEFNRVLRIGPVKDTPEMRKALAKLQDGQRGFMMWRPGSVLYTDGIE